MLPAALRVQIFADGADEKVIEELARTPLVRGFTTNPTLMRAAGVTDYEGFARRVIRSIPRHRISFEVFADEFDQMERQAHKIASWGANVHVKIPITNTRGESSASLLRRLAGGGVRLNATALLTLDQVRTAVGALGGGPPALISVFAGRIADSGRDPVPLMAEAVEMLRPYSNLELIWASPREILNVLQAESVGCHVITMTPRMLGQMGILGRELDQYSLDTVRMFHQDALAAGYEL